MEHTSHGIPLGNAGLGDNSALQAGATGVSHLALW